MLKKLIYTLFAWWGPQTIGTRLTTWRGGERVGADEFGNIYYRSRGGAIHPVLGVERRWVIFSTEADASKVPPGWFGWLHHTSDVAPSAESYVPREWQVAHRPNMTGTSEAYRPPGSALVTGHRPKVTGDYEAWTPG